MSEAEVSGAQKVVGAVGGLVAIALVLGLLFGGVTCGVRVFGGEEAYALWLYRNGIQEGDFTTRHDNGEIASVQPYSNGKINGVARFFDEKGRLLREVTYRNGIQNGPYTHYHLNGKVKERGTHDSGRKLIFMERFDEDGKPLPRSQ